LSKYEPLWKYVQNQAKTALTLSFTEIQTILGFDIDHSFLNFKKELLPLGYQVEKISLKNRTVIFTKK
jgi:hypothetical protein